MDWPSKGFLAGIIGSVPMNITNLLAYKFKLTSLRFVDWASIIMTAKKLSNDVNSMIYLLFIQVLWSGALGIGLAFLLSFVSSKGYYFKAMYISFLFAFVLRGIVVLFKITELSIVSVQSSEINFLPVLLWGLTTAFILRKLNNIKN